MNRRFVLKAGLVLAGTSHTAVAVADTSPMDEPVSVDAFLAKALPAERARYHANALAEAMNEIRPGAYRAVIAYDVGMAMVVDDSPASRMLMHDRTKV